MKKKTLLFVALTVMALGNFTDAFAKLGYFGTGWTKSGFEPRIVDENFQSWPNQPHYTAYPDSCPTTVPDNGYYTPKQIFNLPAKNWAKANIVPFILDSCLIRNACPPVANAGSKLRNPGVSNGFIELKRYYTGGSTPSVYPGLGHLIIGPISFLEYIQYSTSSNGGTKRGFLLEKSEDGGVTWSRVRLEAGNLNLSTSGDDDTECSNGMQWEDDINGVDCYLRFSNYAGQMVRVHDMKIWGDPSDIYAGISYSASSKLHISVNGSRVKLTDYANIELFDISGNLVVSSKDTREVNISTLPSGMYIVKATNDNNQITKKFVK